MSLKRTLCLAAAVLSAAGIISVILNRVAGNVDVVTENDVIVGPVTNMPNGLTLFTDGDGTLPPLWKVTHGESTIYMLGSMHVLPIDCYPLDSRVKAAYENSTAVAVELKNLDAVDLLSSVYNTTLDLSGVCAEGDELKNHLTERQYQLVRATAENSGYDLASLDRMLPWNVYNCLSDIKNVYSSTVMTTYGIDRIFQIQANIDSKPKYSIETPLSRAELYPKMPEDSLGALIEHDLTTDNYNAVYQAWRSGDLDLIYQTEYGTSGLSAESAAAFERGIKYLLTDRNHAMADKAMEFLDSDQTVFFIAGAGHFCGEEGIPELLKAQGCTVERITK